MTTENRRRMWLWPLNAGGFICGIPSMGFLFDHPLMVFWGFTLGIALGLIWVVSASYLARKSFFNVWLFGALGILIGFAGTVVWGIVSGICLRWFEGWFPIFIGNAFLILVTSGLLGSLIGRKLIMKGKIPLWSDAILVLVCALNMLLFIIIPIMALR